MKTHTGSALRANAPAGKSAIRLLKVQLKIITKNLEAAARNSGPDPLHDIRVAVRRFRFILKLFSENLDVPGVKKLDNSLRAFTKTLSEARDHDVWLMRLGKLAGLNEYRSQKNWQDYLNSQIKKRARLQPSVARALNSKKVQYLFNEIENKLSQHTVGSTAGKGWKAMAKPVIGKALEGMPQRLKRKSRLLLGGRTAAMHRLRKCYRKERYLAEIAIWLFGKKAESLLKKIKAATRALGELHDLDMALEIAKTEQAAPPPGLPGILMTQRRGQCAAAGRAVRQCHSPSAG